MSAIKKNAIIFLINFLIIFVVTGSAEAANKPLQAIEIFEKYAHAFENSQSICPNPVSDNLIRNKLQQAYKWYLPLAQKGNADAQYYVGIANYVLLPNGNTQKGYDWLKKSAEQGNKLAMRQLGLINYFGGLSVPQNPNKTMPIALQWLRNAANAGDYYSLVYIGAIYYNGIGIKPNKKQFYVLAKRAAEHHIPFAYATLGDLYFSGVGGAKQDYTLSLESYQKALNSDSLATKSRLFIYYRLSYMYEKGVGTKKNQAKANYWLQRAKKLSKQKQCYLY